MQGSFLPFLDESDAELVAEVEEPSTFLGAREATTAERGKETFKTRLYGSTRSLSATFSPWSQTPPPGEESPTIQNSRPTILCQRPSSLLVKRPGRCFLKGCTILAHRAVGSPGLSRLQQGCRENPLTPTALLNLLTFSVGAWDTVRFSPHHVQTRVNESNQPTFQPRVFNWTRTQKRISRHSLYWSLSRALHGLSGEAAPIGLAPSPHNQSPVSSDDSSEAWLSTILSIKFAEAGDSYPPQVGGAKALFRGAPRVNAKILS